MTDKNNNNKAPYEETFFIIPAYILDLPGMSLGYLKVYWTFFQFWNKRLPCFLSNPAIAQRTKLQLTQVKAALAYFEENGELIRENRGNKRWLIKPDKPIAWVEDEGCAPPPSSSNVNQQVATPTCRTKITQVVAPAPGGGRSTDHEVVAPPTTEYKEENIKNLTNPVVSKFEQFWDIYPKKVGKKPCEQKWKARKLDNHIEDILEKVKEQLANDDKWLRGYAPDPLTYINQERWNDEISKSAEDIAAEADKNKKIEAKRKSDEAYEKRKRLQDEADEIKRQEMSLPRSSSTGNGYISLKERMKGLTK